MTYSFELIVKYVLDHFDQKTYRNKCYDLKGKRLRGFNSIFATSSISACKKYYLEFKEQIERNKSDLIIATIFSFNQNEKQSRFFWNKIAF